MVDMTIRNARETDAAVIVEFNQGIASETENLTLPDAVIRAGVENVLQDRTRGVYYVACDGDQVVGQLMVTLEWSDWRNGWIWWIQSVYVKADYRKQGVFRALYAHVKNLATEDPSVCGLRLYVEQNNTRAQQTYLSLGMDRTHYLVMEEIF
ncbi:MAG: GNAT family N-acetyltransferase [Gammaproteobacteria bacterium]|nr:GNAT family N-acetyltransferase [Gammaproteobacteria bacterium]